jgi:stage V sporulation protein B
MLVKTGLSQSQAIELFGAVSGMAMPVLFIPSTVIGSLSLVLVPELAEDFYKKNVKRLYQNLMRGITVSLLIACFLTPFFYVVGEELGYVAFSNRLAGECIRKGCPILLPMSLTMITTGMLNSMGFEKQTFLYYFLSAGALLLCILFLPRFLGVYAYVAGMIACFSVNAVCNLVLLAKKCPSLFKSTFRKNPKIVRSLALGVITVCPYPCLARCVKRFLAKFWAKCFL